MWLKARSAYAFVAVRESARYQEYPHNHAPRSGAVFEHFTKSYYICIINLTNNLFSIWPIPIQPDRITAPLRGA